MLFVSNIGTETVTICDTSDFVETTIAKRDLGGIITLGINIQGIEGDRLFIPHRICSEATLRLKVLTGCDISLNKELLITDIEYSSSCTIRLKDVARGLSDNVHFDGEPNKITFILEDDILNSFDYSSVVCRFGDEYSLEPSWQFTYDISRVTDDKAINFLYDSDYFLTSYNIVGDKDLKRAFRGYLKRLARDGDGDMHIAIPDNIKEYIPKLQAYEYLFLDTINLDSYLGVSGFEYSDYAVELYSRGDYCDFIIQSYTAYERQSVQKTLMIWAWACGISNCLSERLRNWRDSLVENIINRIYKS